MTQDIYSAEEAAARLKTLPPEVQNLIYSPDMFATIKKISIEAQLHIDQMDALQAETSAVMLGFTEPQDFAEKISQALKVDQSKADALSKAVNDQLFSRIRESMKQLYPSVKPAAPNSTVPPPVETAPVTQPAPTAPVIPEKSARLTSLAPVDLMLQQKTVTTAPLKAPVPPAAAQPGSAAPAPAAPARPEPVKPQPYSTDPYREPPIP